MADDGLVAALARAQQAMTHPKKSKTNPHFKSDYADLADVLNAVRPALNEQGIAVVQTVENGDLVTELRWRDETIVSRLPLNLDVKPQELGSQLSYLRRYALSAIAGVASEADDDGNAAQSAPARQYRQPNSAAPSAQEIGHGKDGAVIPAGVPTTVAQPEKPIAAMTMSEIIAWARENGIPLPSGSKAELIRHLEPLVRAQTGEEPFALEGAEPIEAKDDVTDKPFTPTMATWSRPMPDPYEEAKAANPATGVKDELRNYPPNARASVRRGGE